MSEMVTAIKLYILSLFTKTKELFQKLWFSIFPNKKPSPATRTDLLVEDNVFVPSKQYDKLFLQEDIDGNVLVSEHVWERINKTLPEEYKLPNKVALEVFSPMRADGYDDLIKKPNPTPSVFVQAEVWQKIKDSIPEDYKIPTPVLESLN